MSLLDTDIQLGRDSYYASTAARLQDFEPLQGAASCDVAVVGAGLAGLSAALELRSRGFDVVLLEARRIGDGASGRNGGQVIHGLACDQSVVEGQLGPDDARRVWAMTIEALDLVRRRIAAHRIECDWQSGFLSLARNASKGRSLTEWADRIESGYGYALERIPPGEMARWIASPRFHSGIHDPRSGHLHPLKYTLGLASAAALAGVRIHERSTVTSLEPGPRTTLRTAEGEISAGQALLAGNVYLRGLAPLLESRIMPVGTYIACTEPLDPSIDAELVPSRAAVCDTNAVLDYFRPTRDRRMLYGGGVSYSTLTPANLSERMHRRMAHTFPQLARARIDFVWGGFVDISMNRAPDFGRLPSPGSRPSSIYYLQGFSGHGLALTGLAGQLVAEAMDGDASRFDVFARLEHRSFPGGVLRTPALVLGMAWYRLKDLLS